MFCYYANYDACTTLLSNINSRLIVQPCSSNTVLELLSNYFNKFPQEFDKHKKNLVKIVYQSAFKNEIWFEEILYWLLLLYVKIDEEVEDEV